MAFTYDGNVDTVLEQVRLEIGDTDSTAALYTDEELQVFLDRNSDNVLLSAADAAAALAVRFSRYYDFATDNQKFNRSQMAKHYREMAKDLRARSSSGATTIATTRVDGYSDDIDVHETSQSDVNPRRKYYGHKDRIP